MPFPTTPTVSSFPVVTESAAVHSTTASGNWRGLNSGTVGLGLATTTSSNPLLESQKSWCNVLGPLLEFSGAWPYVGCGTQDMVKGD